MSIKKIARTLSLTLICFSIYFILHEVLLLGVYLPLSVKLFLYREYVYIKNLLELFQDMVHKVGHCCPRNEAHSGHQPDLVHDLPTSPYESRIDTEQEEAEDHSPAVWVEVLVSNARYHNEECSLQELSPIRHGCQFRVVKSHCAPCKLGVGNVCKGEDQLVRYMEQKAARLIPLSEDLRCF